ncbi:MAG: hypothetical protein ACRYGA_04155 [Janthinobacterium lividum]
MDFLLLAALLLGGAYVLKTREQARRIALLGQHLGDYQIEKLIESLTQGYLRCLGEDDAQRRGQIWQLLASSEQSVSSQFARFSAGFARVDEARTHVSKLPIAVPFADRLFPAATFDLRKALAIHARGIADAADNVQQLSPKAKAFTMSAELFLMQHTCHWFCRSKMVASARMMARHRTSYALLVDSVSPATCAAYKALVG